MPCTVHGNANTRCSKRHEHQAKLELVAERFSIDLVWADKKTTDRHVHVVAVLEFQHESESELATSMTRDVCSHYLAVSEISRAERTHFAMLSDVNNVIGCSGPYTRC
jgi:hypothetical protein